MIPIPRVLLAAGLIASPLVAAPAALPATPVERTLAAERTHVYALDGDGTLHVAAEQLGIDVVLELVDAEGRVVRAVDNPLDRRGVEHLLVDLPAGAGGHRLVVRARERGAPAGIYRLRAERFVVDSADDARRLAALAAVSRAGELYREGGAEARRDAFAELRRARIEWRALGETAEEARALYCAAVLARLDGEPRPAASLAAEARRLWRTLESTAFEADAVHEQGLAAWLGGDAKRARALFEGALALRRRAGDAYGTAATGANLCLLDLVAGRLREGARCTEAAARALRSVGAPELESAALASLGHAYKLLGEPRDARRHLSRALELARALEQPLREAQTLHNLGDLERQAGEPEAALALFDQALARFEKLGERRWTARTLSNLGLVYDNLGEPERARAALERSLALRRAAEDRDGEAHTLLNLGWLSQREGEPDAALARYLEALELWPEPEAARRRAEALSLASDAFLALGRAQRALAAARRAGEELETSGDRAGRGRALRREGAALVALGRPDEAVTALERAAESLAAVGDPAGRASALVELARAERARSREERALARVLEAIDVAEGLRRRIANPHLRSAYSGTFHAAYELAVELRMAAHRREPGAGHARAAFELAERARARALVELLAESRVELERGADPRLAAERRELLQRLGVKAEQSLAADPGSPRRDALDEERRRLLQRLDLVEAELRRSSPALATLERPRALSVDEARALLEPGTLLLAYSLGAERSYGWALGAGHFESFELPARGELEPAVIAAHRALADPDPAARAGERRRLGALSETLLAPLAHRLRARTDPPATLVVVADGALHYLPFAALPLPGARGDGAGITLLDRGPVVSLPSASALAALRRRERPAPAGRLAVLADPVVSADDPRLRGGAERPSPPRSALRGGAEPAAAEPTASEAPRLPATRLPASRTEAEALAALAAPRPALVALGFDADRELVLGGALEGFEVVHFATHGVVDAARPARSGLLLSRHGPDGEAKSGFLGLRDLYRLRLAAELVVLSGCRTALGREQRGEGLVGLVHGFFHAGAPRVVASLWAVEDRATAELMTRFYEAMWRRGLPPAEALRAAQLELRDGRRFRDPAHWAGFVLAGEWR